MTRSIATAAKPKKASATKMKELRLKAFEEVVEVVLVIVRSQKLLTQQQREAPEGIDLRDLRLRVYDTHMKQLVDAVEVLGNALHAKQPGGAPANRHFNLAYDILKNHYKTTQKTLRAPKLKETVDKLLPAGVEISDADGIEAFPETVARKVIKFFKLCLPYEEF